MTGSGRGPGRRTDRRSGPERGRTDDERAHGERLDRQYVQRQSQVFQEIEREVFGADYGATSWTDRQEAERMARWLGLAEVKVGLRGDLAGALRAAQR